MKRTKPFRKPLLLIHTEDLHVAGLRCLEIRTGVDQVQSLGMENNVITKDGSDKNSADLSNSNPFSSEAGESPSELNTFADLQFGSDVTEEDEKEEDENEEDENEEDENEEDEKFIHDRMRRGHDPPHCSTTEADIIEINSISSYEEEISSNSNSEEDTNATNNDASASYDLTVSRRPETDSNSASQLIALSNHSLPSSSSPRSEGSTQSSAEDSEEEADDTGIDFPTVHNKLHPASARVSIDNDILLPTHQIVPVSPGREFSCTLSSAMLSERHSHNASSSPIHPTAASIPIDLQQVDSNENTSDLLSCDFEMSHPSCTPLRFDETQGVQRRVSDFATVDTRNRIGPSLIMADVLSDSTPVITQPDDSTVYHLDPVSPYQPNQFSTIVASISSPVNYAKDLLSLSRSVWGSPEPNAVEEQIKIQENLEVSQSVNTFECRITRGSHSKLKPLIMPVHDATCEVL